MNAQPEIQQYNQLPVNDNGYIESGLYYNVSDNSYHSAPGISNSKLKTFADDPQTYYQQFVLETMPGKKSKAMDLGTAVHTAILEPDSFSSRYEKAPALNKNTKAYKEAVAEIEANGKQAIGTDLFDQTMLIRDKVLTCPHAAKLLRKGKPEVSVFGTHEPTGLAGRIRIDWLTDNGFIVDLKTTSVSVDPSAFARQAANLRYHWQDAYYTDIAHQQGIRSNVFVWIVVETTAPYNVKIFSIPQEQRHQAKCQVDYWMEQLALAYEKNHWPSYHSPTLQHLSIPNWALQVPGQEYYNG